MDVHSENIEWMIFELLEGNLNQQEVSGLKKIIEKNPDWQSLLGSYEQTYLEKEIIEFPKKNSLYKTSSIKISWIQKSIAAASILLIISLGWYFKLGVTHKNNTKIPPHQEIQSIVKKIETTPIIKQPKKEKVNNKIVSLVKNPQKKITASKPLMAKSPVIIEDHTFIKQDSIQILVLAERDFWQQMLSNKYLSDEEKLEKLIKWRNINRGNSDPIIKQEGNSIKVNQDPEFKMIFTNRNNLPLQTESTKEEWLKNQIEQVRNFRIPQVQLSTRKRQNSAIPGITIKLKLQNQ